MKHSRLVGHGHLHGFLASAEEKLNPTNKMGIIRQMPAEILRMSPAEVDTSLVGTVPTAGSGLKKWGQELWPPSMAY